MIIEVKTQKTISEFLRDTGMKLDSDCAGRKGCGKCMVKLISGIWECRGKTVHAPAAATACCTILKEGPGIIELPECALLAPQIKTQWQTTIAPLPSSGTVAAVDIGTTTLAAVRIENGIVTATASSFNGQQIFGSDVMTRIAASALNFPELRKTLIDSISNLLDEIGLNDISAIGVAGNTAMCCFLHGIDPSSIGRYPFKAPQTVFPERHDLFGPRPVFTVPAMTGLLGGDITGALHEINLETGEMLLDLGTNCEIVFSTPSGLLGTSAAAGPAFEGAGISCGSRAVSGAVDHYYGKGRFSVTNGGKPVSFCGSGLLDLLAVEHHAGTIDKFGRFTAKVSEMEAVPGVSIREDDIAELLKAKAAVSSAVSALEHYSGTKVKKLKLAGGFSSYLNLDSAFRIGMFPRVPVEIYGNSSLAGAARIASDPGSAAAMAEWAEKIREIHLNEIPGFTDFFTSALLLQEGCS